MKYVLRHKEVKHIYLRGESKAVVTCIYANPQNPFEEPHKIVKFLDRQEDIDAIPETIDAIVMTVKLDGEYRYKSNKNRVINKINRLCILAKSDNNELVFVPGFSPKEQAARLIHSGILIKVE